MTIDQRSFETRLRFVHCPPARPQMTLAEVVGQGLSATPKSLPCRFFYDERGSQLFERICDLPEYYLTRTEQGILEANAEEIIELSDGSAGFTLVEFGSGSSRKTRILMEAALLKHRRLHYTPIDISADFLRASALELLGDYPNLTISAIAAEYSAGIHAVPLGETPSLILFLGSNMGNFERRDAVNFLGSIRERITQEDRILIGIDLVKDREVLLAAYNDAAGITEEFNKNLLVRINKELGGDFNPDCFEHSAPFVEDTSRIEMWLKSRRRQTVTIRALDRTFTFEEGEGIHTENSHKYTMPSFSEICAEASLSMKHTWTDPQDYFAVIMLEPR